MQLSHCGTSGLLVAALVVSAVAWTIGPAAAAPRSPTCGPAPDDAAAVVASITEELDLVLADGRRLRLAGLDQARATAASPDLPARAHRALETWLGGASPAGPTIVTVHVLAPTLDRWNRLPAMLWRSGDPPQSAATVLLRAGLARARPDSLMQGCFGPLLDDEAIARTARAGVWADAHYAILGPEDADGLAEQAGGLVLIEGVLHLHDGRGALYLTLGRDRWGFAAVLTRRDADRFAKAGFDIKDYAGTPVRLRGDLDARFGPRLRLTDPEQVESLEPGSEDGIVAAGRE